MQFESLSLSQLRNFKDIHMWNSRCFIRFQSNVDKRSGSIGHKVGMQNSARKYFRRGTRIRIRVDLKKKNSTRIHIDWIQITKKASYPAVHIEQHFSQSSDPDPLFFERAGSGSAFPTCRSASKHQTRRQQPRRVCMRMYALIRRIQK